jgi:glucosylglycerate phosphorylase
VSTLPEATLARLREELAFLYGDDVDGLLGELRRMLTSFAGERPSSTPPAGHGHAGGRLDEGEAVLITYGDSVRSPGEAPLRTLRRFLRGHVGSAIRSVHLLPFYPWTSDDGFSVVDYLAVDEALGSWADVEALGADYALMFDAVLNHASSSSRMFRGFLAGESAFRDYFVTADPASDVSGVVRPRTSPLLTPFEGASGTVHVWTTFSADQVDLDYRNPRVLLDMLGVLLHYVGRGARILRLDAVTYLWKELGTSCVHHPKTHGVLRLMRTALDAVAPDVVLLTETNVPHHENVSYFGNGHDEAAMVYNFALPPLVLHTFLRGDASALSAWASTLSTPSSETTFFNFLASHDGIGVRPVEALLPEAEVAALVGAVEARDGLVSYRAVEGGRRPYELNVSLFDALNDPHAGEGLARAVDRFAAAHAIMFALAGVPAVYLHSLLGSRNDRDGVARLGYNRAINRAKLDHDVLAAELGDPAGRRARTLSRLSQLLHTRRAERAFHPQAEQRVLDLGVGLFALRRSHGARVVLALTDVSGAGARLSLETLAGQAGAGRSARPRDLLAGATAGGSHLELAPYGVAWLAYEAGG